MQTREEEGLKSLGKKTEYRMDYAPEVLETFVNKHQGNDYWVQFNCPEFTSLCPITGQPDFAEIRISYIPDVRMVESKSLKLYLFSFRNHGDFHEDCVNIIMKDLIKLMDPKYIEVTGLFTPRGGISIYPYANYGRPGTKYEKLAEQRFATHNYETPIAFMEVHGTGDMTSRWEGDPINQFGWGAYLAVPVAVGAVAAANKCMYQETTELPQIKNKVIFHRYYGSPYGKEPCHRGDSCELARLTISHQVAHLTTI